MNAKISVIVPIYNPGKGLERCIGSLLGQTLPDIEIVLVDDCGDDGSWDKALAMTEGCSQVRKVRMGHNSGPGPARNAGIAAATGEYVAFVDADDFINEDFCEKLYNAADGSDLAMCDIRLIHADGSTEILTNPRTDNRKKYLRTFVSHFTTYLYRRPMLLDNGISFPDSRSAEDSCFLICALMNADRIGRVEEPLYNVVCSAGSVSRTRNRSRAGWRLKSFKELLSYTLRHGLWRKYGCIVTRLSLRKGFMLAIRDLITG